MCPSQSTFQIVGEPGTFSIEYGDGTNDAGDFFTDVVVVGESTFPAGILSMGIATTIGDGPVLENDGHGLVGVGYQANSNAFAERNLGRLDGSLIFDIHKTY